MNSIQNAQKTYYKHIFYFSMLAFILLFLVSLLITHGESMRGVIFWDPDDTFMDHFNSVVYNSIDPFENKAMYPPLSTVVYKFLYLIIPETTFYSVISDPTLVQQPPAMKVLQGFMFGFIIFMLVALLLFFQSVNELKQGSKAEKFLFTTVICFSAPFLFMLERGNNIIMPLGLSILYLALYRSENKIAREIALIALGMAVGFKLYPIALGALLLREKKYKDLFRTAIYCILFTIVPFFIFYDGFNSMKLLIENILYNSDKRGLSDVDQLSFSKMLIYALNVLRIRVTDLAAAGKFFNYTVTIASIIAVFTHKKRWKSVLLCTCIIYGFQDVCVGYMLTFLILPLILMLDEEKENKPINYVYILCFILMFAPIPFVVPQTGVWTRYALEKISSYAVGLATGLAIIEGFGDALSRIESKFSINKKASSIITTAAVLLFVLIEMLVLPGAWFNTGIGVLSADGLAKTLKTIISFIVLFSGWLVAMIFLHKKGISCAGELSRPENLQSDAEEDLRNEEIL